MDILNLIIKASFLMSVIVPSQEPLLQKSALEYNNTMNTQTLLTKSCDDDTINLLVEGKYAVHYGKTYAFCFYKNEPLFTIGPHFPLFVCTWILFVGFGIFVYMIQDNDIFKYISLIAVCWEGFIYLAVALRNPGQIHALNPNSDSISGFEKYKNFCKKCRIMKTNKIYHCLECDICIEDYDHHCPWTGKCVGKKNVKVFYTFVLSTLIYIVFEIFAVIYNIDHALPN